MEATPLAPWERALLGMSTEGMKLDAHLLDGSVLNFSDVAIDSARMERDALVFEDDDTSVRVRIYTVPNVKYWVTYYV